MEYEGLKKSLKSVIESQNRYIKDLEHIRDCYFKEIEQRKENEKIFKKDKSNHIPRID